MRPLEDLQKDLKDTILVHGEKSEAAARLKSLIGLVYMDMEDYDKALIYFDDVSVLCRHLGIHHNELGLDNDYRRGKVMEIRAHDEANRREASLVLHEVATLRRNFDAQDMGHSQCSLEEQTDSTLIYYDEAMVIGSTQKDLEPAVALLEKCLALRKRKFGESSAALVIVMLDYADILRSMDRFLEAKSLLNDALEISVKCYGRGHEKVAEVLNSIGNLYRSMFELDEAETYLSESFTIRKEVLPPDDAHLGASLNNLADVKRMKHQYVDAITCHQQALKIFEAAVGPTHPAYINAKGNFGVTLQQYAVECETKGVDYLSEAIDYLHSKAYEADHPWIQKFGHEQVLTSARRLAATHEYARSIQLFDELIKKRQDHIAAHVGVANSKAPSAGRFTAKLSSPARAASATSTTSAVTTVSTDASIIQHIQKGEEDVIHQLELEKFHVMLKHAQKLTDGHHMAAAAQQVEHCEQYIVQPPHVRSSATPGPLGGPVPPDYVSPEAELEKRKRRVIDPETSLNEFELYISLQFAKAKLGRLQAHYAAAMEVLDQTITYIHIRRGRDSTLDVRFRLALAEIHCETGQCSEAQSIITKVMQQLENAVAKDRKLQSNPSLATTIALCQALVVTVDLQIVAHDLDAAAASMDRLQELIRRSHLEEHEVHVRYLLFAIQLNRLYGSYELGINAIEDALNVQNNLTGKCHMDYVSLLLELALLYIQRGAHGEAFASIDEAQRLLHRILAALQPSSLGESADLQSISVVSNNDNYTLAHSAPPACATLDHPLLAKLHYVKAKYYHFLHRLQDALESNTKALEVWQALFPGAEDRPFLVPLFALFAEIHLSKCEYRDCQVYSEKVMALRNNLKAESQLDHDCLSMEYLGLATLVRRGQVFAALQAAEKLTARLTVYKRHFKAQGAMLLDGLVALEYGKALMHTHRLADCKAWVARSGIAFFDFFHQYSNTFINSALVRMAEVLIMQGKHKDAKVTLSFAYNHLHAVLTYRYANHPLMVDLYLVAVENMRAIGYFADAVEYLNLLKAKISVSYGTLTLEYVQHKLTTAKVFKDRHMLNKAEPIFQEIESNISLLCGDHSMLDATTKLELAEALLYADQPAAAEKLLFEALAAYQRVALNARIDASDIQPHYARMYATYSTGQNNLSSLQLSWLELRALGDLCHAKLHSSKPAVLQATMQQMQATLLPYLQETLTAWTGGTAHLLVFYFQGLLAALANKFKLNSGRRQLFDALRGFDEFAPYNIPFDHPFVMALGGYEKASSKSRLSANINENCLFRWSVAREEGADMLPKNMMVDIGNHNETLWANVYYYGNASALESTADEAGTTRRGRGKSAGARSRSPSPHGERGGGSSSAVAPAAMITHDEAFQAEQRARQAAEDQIVFLKHQNADVIEQLVHEKDENERLSKTVNDLTDKVGSLEAKQAVVLEECKQLQDALAAANKELADLKMLRQLEEDEKQRKAAELEAALLADEAAKAKAMHPKYAALLDHAGYLSQKASVLVTQGYYYEAMPLLEEASNLKHAILSLNHVDTLQVYVLKASNLINVEYYESAKELVQLCIQAIDTHGEAIADLPEELRYELQTLLFFIYHKQGTLFAFVHELDTFIKDYGLKIQNMHTETTAHNAHYGRALCLLAHFYAEISKITEAKALIEKSLSILGRECGSTHPLVLEALHIKAYILFYNNKYKECINLCDQRLMAFKISMKSHFDEFGCAVTTLDSLNGTALDTRINPTERNLVTIPQRSSLKEVLGGNKGDSIAHPLVAQTHLLVCRALLAGSRFTETKNKLQAARAIVYAFYKHSSLVTLEYLFLESELLFAMGHYQLALEKHLAVLKEREINVKLNFNMRYGSYSSTAFLNSLAITDAIAQSAIPAGASIMAHNMFTESLFAIAGVYLKMGQHDKAKEYLNNVLKLNVAKNMAPAPAPAPAVGSGADKAVAAKPTSLKGNYILCYYAKGLLLYLQLLGGEFDNVPLYLENLLDELTGNGIHKEHLCHIFLTFLLAVAYFYNEELESADSLLTKAQRHLKSNFAQEHAYYVEFHLLNLQLQLHRRDVLKAWEAVQTLRTLVASMYNAVPEHDLFAVLKVWEGKVRLEALIAKVELPALVVDVGYVTVDNKDSADDVTSVTLPDGDVRAVPKFDNQRFVAVLEVLEEALELYQRSLLLDQHAPTRGPNAALIALHSATINTRDNSPPRAPSRGLQGPPLYVYLHGLIGQTKLLEFTFLQTFINSLSSEEKEVYYSRQSAQHATAKPRAGGVHRGAPGNIGGATGANPDPPGYKDLKSAIHDLQHVCQLRSTHMFVLSLNTTLAELILQFDPLQIAHFNYNKALLAFNRGEYLMASKLFNLVIHSYFSCFGYLQASQSYLMAELLAYKAQVAALLSHPVAFSRNLLQLSTRIFKLHSNSESPTLFVYKNLLAASHLLMQQKMFEEALTAQRALLESVDEHFVRNPVVSPAASLRNIGHSVENVEFNLLMIRTKVFMAQGHFHMYQLADAQQINSEALELLKEVHALDLAPLLRQAASNLGDDDSINRVNDVNALSNSNINALLADLLVQIYMTEVMLHDRWGRFKMAEEYITQIEHILEIWQHMNDAPPKVSKYVGSDEEDEPQVDIIADVVGAREAAPAAAAGLEEQAPEGEVELAASEEVPETAVPVVATPSADPSDAQAISVSSSVEQDVKKKSAKPTAVTTPEAAKPVIPEQGRYLRLKAELLHLRAEHLMALTRFNEVSALIDQSLEIKHQLYNLYYPANWDLHGTGASLRRKPAGPTSVDYVWSAQKEEEVNMNCLITLQALFTSNSANKQDITGGGGEGGAGDEDASEVPRKGQHKDKDDATDYLSMISALQDGGDRDDSSISNLSLLEVFDAKNKKYILHQVFVFRDQKVLPHFSILDSLVLCCHLYLEQCRVRDCKEALDTTQKFLAALMPASSSSPSLFSLSVQHLVGDYKQLVNQLAESHTLHASILEKRLSMLPNQANQHGDVLASYLTLCRLQLLFNNYDEAMQHINMALAIARNIFQFNEGHPRVQFLLLACAEIMLCKGFYADAALLVDKVVATLKLSFSDLHVHIAQAYQLKAQVSTELCRYEEAVNYLNIAKNVFSILFNPTHCSVGMVYLHLAQNFRFLNRFLEAKQHLDLAVVIVRDQLGKYHHSTLFVLLEIGISFIDLGKHNIAVHILERVLYLLKKYLQKDHVMVAAAHYYLGVLYLQTGQTDKVLPAFNTALYIYRKVLNTDRHASVASVLYHMYFIQGTQGAFDAAVQSFDNILAVMKLVYNTPHHVRIAEATFYLATVFLLQNKIFTAQACFSKVIDICKHVFGSQAEPLLMYNAYGALGHIDYLLGNYEQAKAVVERSVAHAKDIVSPQHPSVAKLLTLQGTVYNAVGKYAQAKDVLAEAYQIQFKSLFLSNPNHPDLGETLLALAENCRLRGQYDVIKKKEPKVKNGQRGAPSTAENVEAKEELDEVRSSSKVRIGEESGAVAGASSVALAPASLPDQTSSAQNVGPSRTLSLPEGPSAATEEPPNADRLRLPENIREQDEDARDDESVPSVMISVIEMLDNQPSSGTHDDGSLPEVRPEQASFLDDDAALCALPLIQRAQDIYNAHLHNNPHHPFVFNSKHLLAEVLKMLGRYDEALEMHEEVFHQRRKHLGDQHFDTIQSLVAIADTLRTMKRIYITAKLSTHNATVHQGSNLGTGDVNLKALAKISGTVTLQDHLLALAKPLATGHESKKDRYELDQKMFLTNLEDDDGGKKKKKGLPLPKGYMGYAFPAAKAGMARPTTAGDLLSAFNQNPNRVSANPLHDLKKCLEFATTLLKKVLNKDDPIHTGNQAVVKKDSAHKFEVDHPLLAVCLYNKSEMYRMKGDYAGALKSLEQCLVMRRKLYRSSHVFVSDCLFSMAQLLYTDQRYVQCIPLFNKALEMRVQNLHSLHPSVADAYNAMCLLYIKLGDFTVAEGYIKNALDIALQSLGPAHPGAGNVYVNYAGLCQALGRHGDALEFYKKALDNKLRVYKEGHPEVANVYNNLAMLYKQFGKQDVALEYYEKAADVQKKILGINHPDLATTYNNMATLLSAVPSRRFEAKEFFKQSLNIRISCFGEENALVANTMNNYGILLYELNEVKAARSLFDDAYEIRKKIFNNNNFNNCHPALAESLANIAFWEYNQGSLLEAVALYEQALVMRKQTYGGKSAVVATTHLQLSAACLKTRDMKAALEHAEAAYSMRLDLLGELHTETLAAKKALDYLQNKSKQSRGNMKTLLDRMEDSSIEEVDNDVEREMRRSLFIGEEAMEH